MTTEAVAAVRRFSRFYTNMIGALRAGLLDSPYSLSESRVLFELAQTPEGVDVAELRQRLDMDAGYLSRILGRFEADGLALRERSTVDARRQRISLLDAGRSMAADLSRRSDEQAASLLASVSDVDQRRLVGAMAAIEAILGDPTPSAPAVVLRPVGPGDLGWVVQRHGVLYAGEYGWDETFEAMVARIVADYAAGHDPRREHAWIAEVDGEPVGSIFCVRDTETTAKLRLLFVDRKARGLGVGTRLVDECLRFATRAGYRDIVLFTHDVLADARRIYQRAGFELASSERAPAYGHDLVHQYWRRSLSTSDPLSTV
ncbi:helix-turn-helix domain-containing GNAT family N-acetyltransferase [Dactylosporangium sp. AC04546]|uniref:bifunctional helix-turn-helix transcriptional regulator/GNAT family N-acetyltransferase n=1 Tax=Dactylosporangium sp. AC04546 TaxID=2862460 RepID=UPI001EDEC06A|nr:helix-turn-helix domain-containing GNAT family N-acetyltransferase [Dactylosporangium sp. AC04546]WVK85263.1 helix-turn-helix domain-containing GNAT family N-acetyltransferase [Dactylosporangium sp. AC04546]